MTGPVATIESPQRSPPSARIVGVGRGRLARTQPRTTPAARTAAVETRERSTDITADSFRRSHLGHPERTELDRRSGGRIVRRSGRGVQSDSSSKVPLYRLRWGSRIDEESPSRSRAERVRR